MATPITMPKRHPQEYLSVVNFERRYRQGRKTKMVVPYEIILLRTKRNANDASRLLPWFAITIRVLMINGTTAGATTRAFQENFIFDIIIIVRRFCSWLASVDWPCSQ